MQRSHDAQAINFAEEFVTPVKSGVKIKTARVLEREIEGSEPWLNDLPVGDERTVWATTNGGKKAFGRIRVTARSAVTVKDVTDQHAVDEQFENREAFIQKLREFYPALQDSQELHIFRFEFLQGSEIN